MHAITSSDGGMNAKGAKPEYQTMKIRPRSCRYVGLWVAGPIWLKLAVWDLLLCLGYSASV